LNQAAARTGGVTSHTKNIELFKQLAADLAIACPTIAIQGCISGSELAPNASTQLKEAGVWL
jgi:hypothetical protein